MTHFNYQNNQLFAEQVSLSQIAETFGTPTYVYSKAAIESAYLSFDRAFEGQAHQTCYAVKANSNLGVLDILNNLGAGFDIVSGGELERLLRLGVNANKIVFSGVGKQDWEIVNALNAAIACFNVESTSELEQIIRIATHLAVVAPISIRVNPDVDADTHAYISTGLKENKFGVTTRVAMSMYQRAAASAVIDVVGIDCHIGSQIMDLAPFLEALQRILEMVDALENIGIRLEHIDLGGGVGIRYRDEIPLNIKVFAEAIRKGMGSRRHNLYFEPGRYIVANAGILLTRIIHLKDNEVRHFAIVDAAMNDMIRPALYQSWHGVSAVNIAPTQAAVNALRRYDVVGPVCETSDFLAIDRDMSIAAGDLLSIHSAGAYGFGMSSNYNSRTRAAEVIVSGASAQCVRQRETMDDILRLESPYQAKN